MAGCNVRTLIKLNHVNPYFINRAAMMKSHIREHYTEVILAFYGSKPWPQNRHLGFLFLWSKTNDGKEINSWIIQTFFFLHLLTELTCGIQTWWVIFQQNIHNLQNIEYKQHASTFNKLHYSWIHEKAEVRGSGNMKERKAKRIISQWIWKNEKHLKWLETPWITQDEETWSSTLSGTAWVIYYSIFVLLTT